MRKHDYVPPVLLAYGMGYLGRTFIKDAAAGNAAALDVAPDATIMPWAGIKFDENRQNERARFVLQQLVARRYRVVYPSHNRTAPAILPVSDARK